MPKLTIQVEVADELEEEFFEAVEYRHSKGRNSPGHTRLELKGRLQADLVRMCKNLIREYRKSKQSYNDEIDIS